MNREKAVNIVIVLLLIAIPLWAWQADEIFFITLATKIAILALAGVGLNIALGIGGLVSLGHAAFFGIGGYAMGILASHAQNYDPIIDAPFVVEGTQSMPVIWITAIVIAALAALLIGALSLRTSGVYFIMITLAFGQMFYYFAISWSAYGGEDGLSIYVRNGFPYLNTLDPVQFYAIALCILLLALCLATTLRASAFGLALNASRQTELRVQTVGIDTYRLKLVAFVISGVITALAGALYADLNRFVSPTMFSWQTSGEIMMFIILGGVGRLFAPVVGAAVFILLEYVLGGVSDYWHIFLGLILLAVVLFARGGLIGLLAPESKGVKTVKPNDEDSSHVAGVSDA